VKKARVLLWVGARQKERLEELSRNNRMLISGYIQEAIEDLLKKYEEPKLKLVAEKECSGEKEPELTSGAGLKRAEGAGGG